MTYWGDILLSQRTAGEKATELQKSRACQDFGCRVQSLPSCEPGYKNGETPFAPHIPPAPLITKGTR